MPKSQVKRDRVTKSPSRGRYFLRWMIRRDMPDVLDIETDVFAYPWHEEDFFRVLRQRNCIGMVAEHEDRVVGFVVYELYKASIVLLSIAVARDKQRHGVGRQLLQMLIGKLSAQRRRSIVCEVGERNLDAQLFFRRMGFVADKVLREHYPDDADQDAYRFVYRVCSGK